MPLIKDCLEKERLLAAICDATAFLGKAGILNQYCHTSNDLDDLKEYAGENYDNAKSYKPRQVVRDRNLITANGTAAVEFAREIAFALEFEPDEQIENWFCFHKLGLYETDEMYY